ncbi:hypothetical protein [Streptomyces sp. NPDC059538]|uniref:hypothetical protein n=1 Tax=Streptomyces sp. NPDC059538 TaxID=3346860 RepID=UPI00367D67DB
MATISESNSWSGSMSTAGEPVFDPGGADVGEVRDQSQGGVIVVQVGLGDRAREGAGACAPYDASAAAAEVVPPTPSPLHASTHFDAATGHLRNIRPKGYAVSTDRLLAYRGLELMPSWFVIALLVLALIGIGLAISRRRR